MKQEEGRGIGRKREPQVMRVIPRFVYNPEKCERGLKAMADILAGALRRANRDSGAQQDQAPE